MIMALYLRGSLTTTVLCCISKQSKHNAQKAVS